MIEFDRDSHGPVPLAEEALSSLASHVAVLDRGGVILAVNEAWTAFGLANGADASAIAPPVNYLTVCAGAVRDGAPHAAAALAGIEAVCTSSRGDFELEYRFDSPGGSEWYLMKVTPLHHEGGGAVVSHRNITVLKRRELDLRQRSEARLRDLAARLVSAQEEERRRIARELHDDVNQRLALLAIEVDQLILSERDAALQERLRGVWERTGEISREIHNLSHELHSSTLDALGIVAAMRTLCRELSEKGLRVVFSGDAESSDLAPEAALALFRIAQEALTNVLKHGGVNEAALRLDRHGDCVSLRIEDHGAGFDPVGHGEGLGLLSMRERLLPLGGELTIRSRPGEGTTVEACVPRAAD